MTDIFYKNIKSDTKKYAQIKFKKKVTNQNVNYIYIYMQNNFGTENSSTCNICRRTLGIIHADVILDISNTPRGFLVIALLIT